MFRHQNPYIHVPLQDIHVPLQDIHVSRFSRTSEKRQYENEFKVELKQLQKKMYDSGTMCGFGSLETGGCDSCSIFALDIILR